MRLSALLVMATVGMVSADLKDFHFKLLSREFGKGVPGRNDALQQIIDNLLEQARDIILNGSGNIPPLDPYVLKLLHLDLSTFGLEGSQVTFEDGNVTGLGLFEVVHQDLRLSTLIPLRFTLDIELKVPALHAYAEKYDLHVTAMGYEVFGKGIFDALLKDLAVKAVIVLSPNFSNGITIVINELDLRFAISAFESSITGLFGDEQASSFANLFLKNFVPDALVTYENEISHFVSPIAMRYANELLDGVNLGDLPTKKGVKKNNYFNLFRRN